MDRERIEAEIVAYLQRHEKKELLRFVIVGSVDDGKSTLIGRLLHDLNAVYDDQLAAVQKATTMAGGAIDFSLFTDGLAAEREQGITIDVAYRYFATERRKFIVADTPGHVQYTRNMVTGASTADVCVILIDARLGVLEQSRRHAYLASLLGISHLLVAVNKMDLRGYEQAVYDDICRDLGAFVDALAFESVTFVPICATKGENLATPAATMPWYRGPTVLGFLDEVPVGTKDDRSVGDFRYPVQYVLRPNLDYRGFAGQIASGVVRTGDAVMILPSGRRSKVKAIDTFAGERAEAFAPESVTLRLEDEVDCSRGDMIVHAERRPRVMRTFDADIVWLHERALDPHKTYLLKHTTRTVRMQVARVLSKIDLTTLEPVPAETLALNEIGQLTLTCHQPLYFDAYTKNRATGSFIVVDSLTNSTVGAGMIRDDAAAQDLDAALREARAGAEASSRTQVSAGERAQKLGQSGFALLLHGEPTGARTIAFALERRLYDLGHAAHVLTFDGAPAAAAQALAVRACSDAGLVTIWTGAATDAAAIGAALAGEKRHEFAVAADEPPAAAVARLIAVLTDHGQLDR